MASPLWNVERAVKYRGVLNQKLQCFFQQYVPKQNMLLNTAVFHKWKKWGAAIPKYSGERLNFESCQSSEWEQTTVEKRENKTRKAPKTSKNFCWKAILVEKFRARWYLQNSALTKEGMKKKKKKPKNVHLKEVAVAHVNVLCNHTTGWCMSGSSDSSAWHRGLRIWVRLKECLQMWPGKQAES